MATPRKVGKKWRIEIQRNGQSASGYFDTKQLAINFAIEKEAQFVGGTATVEGRKMSDLFAEYAKHKSPNNKGVRWERVRLAKLSKGAIGKVPTTRLSLLDLEQWRDSELLRVSGSTVNREIALLQSVVKYGIKRRWMKTNPVAELDRPKNSKPRKKLITPEMTSTILNELDVDEDNPRIETKMHELGVVLLLALESAMRLGEIVTLDWSTIRLEESYLTLLETKNGDDRDVPLSPKAIKCLKAAGEKKKGQVFKIGRDSASTLFRRVRKKCEIEGVTFHDSRHSAITRLAKIYTPMELARVVGHRNLNQTLIYYNEHASSLADKLR